MEFLSLKTAAFGLEITDLNLRMVDLKKKNGKTVLSSLSGLEIASGIVEAGEVKDVGKLAEAIKNCLKKTDGSKIEKRHVVVSLPDDKAFLQVIQMPKIGENDLRLAVPFEAENYIPMALEKACFDYQAILDPSENINHLDVLIAAFPKNTIDLYVEAVKEADLVPIAFELESQAIARALVKNGFSEGPILIIHVGDVKTNLMIYAGYSLRISFSIPISNKYFIDTISKILGIGAKEAEVLKNNYGIEKNNNTVGVFGEKKKALGASERKLDGEGRAKRDKDQRAIFEALVPSIIDFTQQIEKYLNYYHTHASHEHLGKNKRIVGKIILCGAGANLKGLDQLIGLRLGLPVQKEAIIFDGPFPFKGKNPVPDVQINQFVTAFGLAIRGLDGKG